MSDHDEVPDLSAEAKLFLERHERTGEPAASGLARGQQRLAAQTLAAAPTRLRKRRPLVPPEVTAAAAVVALVLGGQVLYLTFRAQPVASTPTPAEPLPPLALDADARALLTAWRAGDLEGARRLASNDCRSGACRAFAADVARALGLADRLDSLAPGELDELASLDGKLAGGANTSLGDRVAQRQHSLQQSTVSGSRLAEADELFAVAQQDRAAKNFERAAIRLEKCIKTVPTYAPCRRLAGSVYAAIAARDQSAADMEKARRHYEAYVELAPANDEYVPKVQAILEAAKEVPEVRDVEERVAVGRTRDLNLPDGLMRLAVGDPSVADVSVVDGKVRVTGVSPGKTTLLVWRSNGTRESRLIVVEPARQPTQKVFAEAQRAWTAGDWVRAVALARQVLLSDRKHSGAAALVLEARHKAREAYLRGYQLRDSHPVDAIEQFQLAVSLTDDDDDTHQKALARLEEVENR